MAALYELAAGYRALADRLNDSEQPAEVIADTLDGEAGDLEDKVTNTAKVIQNMRAEAKAIREAMADMSARVAASTAPDKSLIKSAMQDGFPVPGAHIEQHVTVAIK